MSDTGGQDSPADDTAPNTGVRDAGRVQPIRTQFVAHADVEALYPDRVLVRGFEGGAVYRVDGPEDFVLITDESTLIDMLEEENRDLSAMAVTLYVFATAADRSAYADARGWVERRPCGGGLDG